MFGPGFQYFRKYENGYRCTLSCLKYRKLKCMYGMVRYRAVHGSPFSLHIFAILLQLALAPGSSSPIPISVIFGQLAAPNGSLLPPIFCKMLSNHGSSWQHLIFSLPSLFAFPHFCTFFGILWLLPEALPPPHSRHFLAARGNERPPSYPPISANFCTLL